MRRAFTAFLFVLGLGAVVHGASAPVARELPPGTPIDAVVRLYGWPRGRASAGAREVWSYDGFEVIFENGRVIEAAPQVTTPTRRPNAYQPLRPAIGPRHPLARPPNLLQLPPPGAVSVAPGASSLALRPQPSAAVDATAAPAPTLPDTLNQGAGANSGMSTTIVAALSLVVLAGLALVAIIRQRRSERRFDAAAQTAQPATAKPDWQQHVAQRLQQLHQPIDGQTDAPQPPLLTGRPDETSWRDVGSPHLAQQAPAALTLERLRELEWKRFELIVARYFGATGLRAVPTCVGADGGIDVKLYGTDESAPCALVQCKAWGAYKVGIKPVRELFGVMADEQVTEGYFVTTSTFTGEARAWVANKQLHLVDGPEFVAQFNALEEVDRGEILAEAFAGDYRTPTCPNCDVKLVVRTNAHDQTSFWSCPRFPRCRYTLNSASAADAA